MGDLPDWLTGVLVPLLSAGLVLAGLIAGAVQRDGQRRARLVAELSELLTQSANTFHDHGAVDDDEDSIREGMASNSHRVAAASQMKLREKPVYDYANDIATRTIRGEFPKPNAETAAAIDQLLRWQFRAIKAREISTVFPSTA